MDPQLRLGRLLIELAFWFSLAGVAFALTFQFSDSLGTYAWGAASWPRAVILLIALGAAAQFLVRLRARGAMLARPGTTDGAEAAEALPVAASARLKLVAALLLPLLYAFLLRRTGFYATTPFFLAAYLVLLGERRPKMLLGVPILIYVAINLVFTSLFYVPLPTGNWPGFYDFSNWLLVLLR